MSKTKVEKEKQKGQKSKFHSFDKMSNFSATQHEWFLE